MYVYSVFLLLKLRFTIFSMKMNLVSGEDLIAPCHCKGTQKYVHRSCLDNWRSTKVSFPSFHIASLQLNQHFFSGAMDCGIECYQIIKLPRADNLSNTSPFIYLSNVSNSRMIKFSSFFFFFLF